MVILNTWLRIHALICKLYSLAAKWANDVAPVTSHCIKNSLKNVPKLNMSIVEYYANGIYTVKICQVSDVWSTFVWQPVPIDSLQTGEYYFLQYFLPQRPVVHGATLCVGAMCPRCLVMYYHRYTQSVCGRLRFQDSAKHSTAKKSILT